MKLNDLGEDDWTCKGWIRAGLEKGRTRVLGLRRLSSKNGDAIGLDEVADHLDQKQ